MTTRTLPMYTARQHDMMSRALVKLGKLSVEMGMRAFDNIPNPTGTFIDKATLKPREKGLLADEILLMQLSFTPSFRRQFRSYLQTWLRNKEGK